MADGKKIYIVTDREDKDREDPVIDFFETCADAEAFAAEWRRDFGDCQIEEWPSLEDCRG